VHHAYERPPDWSEWTRFQSADGIFSVELPGTPQPSQADQQNFEGEVRRVAVSAIHAPSNMRFSVLCAHTDRPLLLDEERERIPTGFSVQRQEEIVAAGYPATLRRLTGQGMLVVVRDISIAENAFCRQAVTLEALHEKEARPSLDRFFGSLRLKPRGEWVMPLEP
jgi:hypothetical protein